MAPALTTGEGLVGALAHPAALASHRFPTTLGWGRLPPPSR